MRNLLWYVFAGTRGGVTRARMVAALRERPMNAHQLSKRLGLDYKTVRHHLGMLEKNRLLYALEKQRYGAVYFLSEALTGDIATFDEILDKMGKDLGKSS